MYTIQAYTKCSPQDYDTFIASHPDATLYHTRAWLGILADQYGYHPASLVARDSAGALVGLLPLMQVQTPLKGRRLVSLPFSHCVPILAADEAIQTALLQAAIHLTQAENYAYLHIKTPTPPPAPGFQPALMNHISELRLDRPLDAIWGDCSKNNRRDIRRSLANDSLTLRRGTTQADFASFEALEVTTRHRQGAPMYPPGYFTHLGRTLGDAIRLYLMTYQGRDVAALLAFHWGQRAIYAYGSSLRDEAVNKLTPNNGLVWHAIEQAHQDGLTVFDFGTTPLHHDSLFTFKNRFRPDSRDLPYWYWLHTRQSLPTIQRDSRSVRLVEALLRGLPRPLFRMLSPKLLREVG